MWYDLETTGVDPRGDRILQLAAQRTDLTLHPIGEPINLFCRPDPDLLPSVTATLVTRIDPEDLTQTGLDGPTFVRQMLAHMSQPGTCAVGYNSLRFDDEFVRHTLWRHLLDPYGREWKSGNSRWDLLGLVRLCRALRPRSLRWPLTEEGFASLRLEDLAAINGLPHDQAHDALSDVTATLGLARRILQVEPKLFQYALTLRDKRQARRRLRVDDPAPVLHVDLAWGRHRDGLTAVLALGELPQREVLVVDLSRDPEELLECPDAELHTLLFPAWGGSERPPVRAVRLNRCPAVAPMGVLDEAQQAQLDLPRIQANARTLLAHRQPLLSRLEAAFAARSFPPEDDPERQLYDGFIGDLDRERAARVHDEGPDAVRAGEFDDPRLSELFFRYRARYHPTRLSPEERVRWAAHARARLIDGQGGNRISLRSFAEELARHRERTDLRPGDHALLDALERYGRSREAWLRSASAPL